MDETEIKYVVEAALLAAGRPLTLDRLAELFTTKGPGVERATLKRVMEALANDYAGRGIELAEVSSGYRIQIRRTMSDWLVPLWEEKAPRYTRALLETLALVAYRQPITRAEIEEVRGVVVSTNIMRTLLERGWVRVVGHRDVPGKPAMFGTTREFLDYFGLKKLEDLPPLAELKDGLPELSPQTDLIESLEAEARGEVPALATDGDPAQTEAGAEEIATEAESAGEIAAEPIEDPNMEAAPIGDANTAVEPADDSTASSGLDDDSRDDDFDELDDDASDDDFEAVSGGEQSAGESSTDSDDDAERESADVIPLRATSSGPESSE